MADLTDDQLLTVFKDPRADLSLLTPAEQKRLVVLTEPKPYVGRDVRGDSLRALQATSGGEDQADAPTHPLLSALGHAAYPQTAGDVVGLMLPSGVPPLAKLLPEGVRDTSNVLRGFTGKAMTGAGRAMQTAGESETARRVLGPGAAGIELYRGNPLRAAAAFAAPSVLKYGGKALQAAGDFVTPAMEGGEIPGATTNLYRQLPVTPTPATGAHPPTPSFTAPGRMPGATTNPYEQLPVTPTPATGAPAPSLGTPGVTRNPYAQLPVTPTPAGGAHGPFTTFGPLPEQTSWRMMPSMAGKPSPFPGSIPETIGSNVPNVSGYHPGPIPEAAGQAGTHVVPEIGPHVPNVSGATTGAIPVAPGEAIPGLTGWGTPQHAQQLIAEIPASGAGLNGFEREALESIREQVAAGRPLSIKQTQMLQGFKERAVKDSLLHELGTGE